METQEVYETRRMEVADYILEHPEEFNMGTFGQKSPCGTTACIAGTAILLAERQGLAQTTWFESWDPQVTLMGVVTDLETHNVFNMSAFARDYLGLSRTTLFYVGPFSPEEAAKELLAEPYIITQKG